MSLEQIQKEGEELFDKTFEEVILDQEVKAVSKGIKLFIHSRTTLAYQAGEKAICELILSKAKENYSGSSSFLVLDDKAITEIMQIVNKEKLSIKE